MKIRKGRVQLIVNHLAIGAYYNTFCDNLQESPAVSHKYPVLSNKVVEIRVSCTSFLLKMN